MELLVVAVNSSTLLKLKRKKLFCSNSFVDKNSFSSPKEIVTVGMRCLALVKIQRECCRSMKILNTKKLIHTDSHTVGN